jgi:predicted Zn-dependent protease
MKRFLSYYAFALCATFTLAAELPDLGSPTDYLVSAKEQRKLKDETRAHLSDASLFLPDILSQYYIQRLGERLRQASHQPKKGNFDFFIANSPVINAYAAPGGYIGVNSGLILASEDEDELAGVLAHEIAHVNQGHILRAYAQAKQMQLPMLLGGIAMVAIGMANPELGSGVLLGGLAGMAQSQATFSREHEQEADRFGMGILQRAGFDAKAMIRVFQRFAKQEQYYGVNMPEFLRSHPMNANRITDIENRLGQGKQPEINNPTSNTFALIKARIMVFSEKNPGVARRYFLSVLKKKPQSLSARYGLALAELQLSHASKAYELLSALSKEQPDNTFITISLAESLQALKRYQEANQRLHKLALNYPDDLPITVIYTESLLDSKEIEAAHKVLSHALIKNASNILLLDLMVRTQFAKGEKARAYWYLAKIYTLLDQPELATAKLKRALREKPLDFYLESKIKAQLAVK